MILEIENIKTGKQIGAIKYSEFDEYEGTDELIIKKEHGNVKFLNTEFDDIFDSNDVKMKIGIKQEDHFLTLNYETISGKTPKDCIPLIKELNSYCCVLKHYYNNNYRDVWVLIQNYFGHINYGKEFGYFKTHDEICDILLYNFFISHEKEFKDHFEDFCKRQIGKIRWNLENEHNYIIDEEYIEKRIYGDD